MSEENDPGMIPRTPRARQLWIDHYRRLGPMRLARIANGIEYTEHAPPEDVTTIQEAAQALQAVLDGPEGPDLLTQQIEAWDTFIAVVESCRAKWTANEQTVLRGRYDKIIAVLKETQQVIRDS